MTAIGLILCILSGMRICSLMAADRVPTISAHILGIGIFLFVAGITKWLWLVAP